MLSHRFMRYIVGIGIIAVFAVSFTGYKAYQNYIEFERFMSQVVDLQESLNKDGDPLEHKESEKLDNSLFSENQDSNLGKSLSPPVKVRVYSEGKITNIKVDRSKSPKIVPVSEMVKQRVQTPDGKIHTIWLPPDHKVKDGDMLSEAFFNLPPPPNFEAVKGIRFRKSDIPEGESIESYGDKLFLSRLYGVSIEEVERMIESGTIQLPKVISRSSKVVSVDEFMDHDPPLQSSGDVEYLEKAPQGADNTSSSGGISDDLQSQTSTLPRLNSASSSKVVSDPSKMPASSTVSHEGLSPEHFDKAQQLVDEYGTEEGLRRFREMDPEAAQQFESDKSRPGRERRSPPAREAPNEVEFSTQ